MRRTNSLAIAALIALPMAAWVLPTRADTPAPRLEARITVTGEGRVEAAPDLATLSIGVTSTGKTASQAMTANSSALAAVLANLRAAGVAERDLQTSGLSLNPAWSNYSSDRQPEITGFRADNTLTVRMRDLDRLGTVLDAAITDGANTLNGLAFGIDDPAPLLDRARALAVADARRRAGVLAEAAGVGLGRVLSITEGGANPPPPQFRMDAALAAEAVPVAAGEVGLAASVTIVWEVTQ